MLHCTVLTMAPRYPVSPFPHFPIPIQWLHAIPFPSLARLRELLSTLRCGFTQCLPQVHGIHEAMEKGMQQARGCNEVPLEGGMKGWRPLPRYMVKY